MLMLMLARYLAARQKNVGTPKVLTHQPTSQHHHRLTDPRPNRQYNPLKKSAKPFKKTIDICTDIYIMHGTDSNAP